MTKAHFIQSVFAKLCPKQDDWHKALGYAERLWDWLTEKGYGMRPEAKPREAVDWYERLQGAARAQFDRFWDAYAYKKDRNGAAMRWYQLGDLSDTEAQRIIDAARVYAREQLPGDQVRKMAQGWLYEKRWQDIEPTRNETARERAAIQRGLQAHLASLKRLYALKPTEDLARQIEEAQHKMTQAGSDA